MDMLKQQKPPLMARQYRELWLDSADELGLVAEILSEVLGWQPSPDQPLPDALELAQAAAERIIALEAIEVFGKITRRQLDSSKEHLTIWQN